MVVNMVLELSIIFIVDNVDKVIVDLLKDKNNITGG